MRFLLVLLLILCGCGHNYQYVSHLDKYSESSLKEYKIWIDKDFSPADQVSIWLAVEQWNYSLNGHVKLRIMGEFDMEVEVLQRVNEGEGWVIMRIDSQSNLVRDKGATDNSKWLLAWVNSINGNRMWIIDDRIKDIWMYGIVLHEIGHLLGASHNGEGLMRPGFKYHEYRCVDKQTIKKVAVQQHVDVDNLNYCTR